MSEPASAPVATLDVESLVERCKAGDRRAAEALVAAVQDDLFRLAARMLGTRADAEDATQEILLQALTHLSEFRGESAFRTWLWRIAVRHLMRLKKGRREQMASFEVLDSLLASGERNPPLPMATDAELTLMAEEVRMACTQGVLLSLERPQRVAWILSEVFELSSEEVAAVLEIEAATFRKRLSRARERLEAWFRGRCGLANGQNACRCKRQIPVAAAFGVLDLHRLQYASHSRVALRIVAEADQLESAASLLTAHAEYRAPSTVLDGIRALINSGRYRVFDA